MATARRVERTDLFAQRIEALAANLGHVIQGKPEVISLVLLCLFSGGHLLLEDVPGVGKTSLAKSLATSLGGTFGRIQFTPDLLPADVTGVSVWDRASNHFEFHAGPIFANIVLGDELNRASPKTQSALLEAMAERQVTIDGYTHHLAAPFMVIATQNPLEHEGTYPLPDSQLDRFFMRVSMGHPSPDAELRILATRDGVEPLDEIGPVMSAAELVELEALVERVEVAAPLRAYLVQLAQATRGHPALALGMSPRATLNLQRAARARAAASGRSYVVPDDIKALAVPVLAHRLLLAPDARLRGATATEAIYEVLQSVPVPTGRQGT